jgi:hypothetical protein
LITRNFAKPGNKNSPDFLSRGAEKFLAPTLAAVLLLACTPTMPRVRNRSYTRRQNPRSRLRLFPRTLVAGVKAQIWKSRRRRDHWPPPTQSTARRSIWIAVLQLPQWMRPGWRLVLRIRLAITAEATRGVHALLKCCKAAICAARPTAVNRAPGIILGFGSRYYPGCCDEDCQR